jgi:hypothetical protein
MFNLEQSITEWRRRMLAAGIQTPEPLGELEIHLREEIERLRETGLNEQMVFESAVADLGPAGSLKSEFSRAHGVTGWLGPDKATKARRVLGILWLAQNSWGFGHTVRAISRNSLDIHSNALVVLTIIIITIIAIQELGGIIGGVLLIRDAKGGRRMIRILALFDVVLAMCLLCGSNLHGTASWGDLREVVFDVATIWLLRPAKKAILAAR